MRSHAVCRYTPDCDVRTRFAAALVLSLAVHAMLGASGGAGSRRQQSGVPPPDALRVEIVAAAPRMAFAEVEPPRETRATPTPPPQRPRRPNAQSSPPGAAQMPQAAEESGVPAIPDFTWYPARELDVYPVLAQPLELRYPGAGAPSATARVLLLVMIEADGAVNEVSVVEVEPRGLFEAEARRAFSQARFKPALRHGRPVRSRGRPSGPWRSAVGSG